MASIQGSAACGEGIDVERRSIELATRGRVLLGPAISRRPKPARHEGDGHHDLDELYRGRFTFENRTEYPA